MAEIESSVRNDAGDKLSESVLIGLGVDVFSNIVKHILGGVEYLSLHDIAKLKPLAISCRAHYQLIRSMVNKVNLESKHLESRKLQGAHVKRLFRVFPCIDELQVHGPFYSDIDVLGEILQGTRRLKSLVLGLCNARVTTASCTLLESYTSLKYVVFTGKSQLHLPLKLAVALSRLPSLEDVSFLTVRVEEPERFFTELFRSKSLIDFNLSWCRKSGVVAARALAQSERVPFMRCIKLMPLKCSHDDIVSLVDSVSALRRVFLGNIDCITYRMLKTLADRAPQLELLYITAFGRVDKEMEKLSFRSLRLLNLGGMSSTDDIILRIVHGGAPLEDVLVRGSRFSDVGVAALCSVKSLHRLYIGSCNLVTDACVPFLEGAPLKQLAITNCSAMTSRVVDQLMERFGIYVVEQWACP